VVVIDGWATAHQHGISIGSVGCGEIVGNLSTLGLDHQPLTVTARTNVVVMDFDEKDFCDLVLHSSVLSLALARMYARKLRVIRSDLYPPTQIW
jgi:CRP-like cAMP-binding protein